MYESRLVELTALLRPPSWILGRRLAETEEIRENRRGVEKE